MDRHTALVCALIASIAACATGPGNTYGSGGSTGNIQVKDSVTGSPGSNVAFTVSINATTKPLAKGGVASFLNLDPGDYAVDLGGTMGNCTVVGGSSQAVHVFPGYTQYLTFITSC